PVSAASASCACGAGAPPITTSSTGTPPSGARTMFKVTPLGFRPGLLAMFVGVTLLFAWYRQSVCFVWDDSPNISAGVAHTRWLRELQGPGPGPNLWQSASHLWQDTFGYICGGGYRPLSTLYSLLTSRLFINPESHDAPSLIHLLFVGTIY